MTDEIRDETWRTGPPPALEFMVFQQTYDMMFNMVLREIKTPPGVTLENVSDWLKKNRDDGQGVKYTVMSVGTKDVFERLHIHDEVIVSNITSIVY